MKIIEIGTGYTSIPARMGAATEIVVEELTKSYMKQKKDVLLVDIASDDSHEIVVAIIDYLRNLGYNASVAKKVNGYYASLLISWVKPLEKEQENKED